ncbi:MAG TPA: gliding motility lipoprotein GldB [Ohtaekwangia sp.]|nr:gliding motility lipoprotein GldB [Ohtaekwangia sp.]
MKKLIVIALFFAAGCTSKKDDCVFIPDPSEKVTLVFEQFEDSLVNVSSRDELVRLLTRQPLIRDYIFRRAEYPDDNVFIDEIYNRFANPHLDTLLAETRRVFGDLSGLKAEFEEAFTNLKYYYPDFQAPKVQTVISGLDTDLMVSDSLIIVSLDWYLGPGAKYRPKMYEYLLRKYDPDDIVTSCLLIYGISPAFNKTDMADKTVLADMIAYGKSFYFAKHMLPCVPDSTLIWYTPEELNGSRQNQDLIWTRFVADKVLYSTSHVDKQNYLGERPVTVQVGEKCPGRIGQWVGWQIVNAYMDAHENTTLPELMGLKDAQRLFKESRYKPERGR